MKRFTVLQIMQFILVHYARARDWNAPQLFNWICWNIEHGFCLLVGDDDKIQGLAFVRTMMLKDCAKEMHTLYFDPEGDTYFVDLAIAPNPKLQALQALGFAGHKRFGQRDYIAYQRQGEGPVIITNAREHRNKILRKHKV